MASGKTLQSTVEISGVLSPSLQKAIKTAVDKLEDMSKETLESADAATRLAAEMNEQENVLNALKRAYAGYAVEGKEGSEEAQKLARKIQDVSGELNENKQKLDAAERAANSFGNELDEAEDKAEKASDGFTVMKGVLSNLVTKGLELAAEGVQKLYDSYMEYDNGADTIIAKTGATGKAAESLQKVYKNVSKSVPGSFEDIGTAVGEINTRFGLTDGALEDLSTKFIKFAELNDTDVNSSVDSVQKSLEAFGLDAKEAGGVLDTLNKVGQDSGIAMETLTTSLFENASSFSQMGLDIHQSAGFLGEVEKSGVATQVAMTALSKASQYAAEENKPLADILEKTTQKMANAKTDAEGLQIAYDVFGKKAGAKIYEACKTGSLSFDDLAKAMENNAGSIDSTYEATQDGMDKIKLALQSAKASAGDAMAGFLDEHKDDIISVIESIQGGISAIANNLPAVGVIIGGVAAAVTAFKIAAWSAKLATEGFTIATKLQAIAQGALNAIMNANPIGLIILGITALVAGFMILWNNCEGFRNFWIGLWDGIKYAVSVAVEWIKDCWERIKIFFTGDNPIARYFQLGWETIKIVWSIAVSYFQTIWENIKLVFSAVKSVLSGDFAGAWAAIKQIFSNWGSFFSGLFSKVESIFGNIKEMISIKINAAKDAVKAAIDKIKGFFNFNWDLPKIKLPHFSIEGKFSLNPPSIPKLSVSWYKDGGILTQPTIFGAAGNTLLAGGEAGAEAVVPLATLWDKLETMIRAVFNSASSTGEPIGAGLTSKAGELLTLDNFSLGSLADGTSIVIYYDFSGFTWSPQIQTGGTGEGGDDLMARLKAHEAEFFDWLEEFIKMREVAQYA